MIQTHPPFGDRLKANAQLLASTPQATAKDDEPKSLTKVSNTTGEFGVQGMFASKTQHATASQNVN